MPPNYSALQQKLFFPSLNLFTSAAETILSCIQSYSLLLQKLCSSDPETILSCPEIIPSKLFPLVSYTIFFMLQKLLSSDLETILSCPEIILPAPKIIPSSPLYYSFLPQKLFSSDPETILSCPEIILPAPEIIPSSPLYYSFLSQKLFSPAPETIFLGSQSYSLQAPQTFLPCFRNYCFLPPKPLSSSHETIFSWL